MLLERLRDYSERLPLTPVMYLETPIRWIIDLDAKGQFVNFISTRGSERRDDRGLPRLAPHQKRTSTAVRPKLLADNAEYVLGLARDPDNLEHVNRSHAAFLALVRDCAKSTNEPTVQAVSRFLESFNMERLLLPDEFNAAHVLTFKVDGIFPIDLASVRDYWASVSVSTKTSQQRKMKRPAKSKATSKSEASEEQQFELHSETMPCLVCGRDRPAVSRMPISIKRIRGGQPAGMALVSTNKVAFESYGLEAISCAPICQECGERFSKAANALIEGEDTHISLGPLVYIFWTRDEIGFRPGKMLSQPRAEQVKALYEAAWKADPTQIDRDPTRFYATALSASGGRVVVRDWVETTVPAAQRNLARYFALQELVEQEGSESKPIGLYGLAASTVRDANRDLAANVPRALIRLALNGGELPNWLLYQAIKRNRAEQRVTRPRAALIKMALLSKLSDFPQPEESRMTRVEPNNHEPAYLCGRLLAVLERVQKTAIPGAKATITDRFFGTASSAPASVFGRLLRGAQAHLGKLRKERPGTYTALEKRLEEVQEHLAGFPRTLTLQQQGLFSLGYYHERAKDRAAAAEHKAAKDADKKSPQSSTN